MKKVISGNELYDNMSNAINILCSTVKSTLGPICNNVIIDHSNFSPFITNDGVTIAENITSENEVINTILELAKEASIKTNENVGDGTTTTLVLLESIFNLGLNLIRNGMKPMKLKNDLISELDNIIKDINLKSRKANNKDLINIAINSANDIEIGKIVSDAYSKVKDKNAINIVEYDIPLTRIEYLKGYCFETILASPYFLYNNTEIKYTNSKILLVNSILDDINVLSLIFNEVIKNNNSLIIIANDYEENFINQVLSLKLDNNLNIVLLKTPEYGFKSVDILNDISIITNAKIIDNNDIKFEYLGNINNIVINDEIIRLEFKINNDIRNYINKLKKLLKHNSTDNEFIKRRISMFKYGTANIYVGGTTKIERIEKKMRYDDALCSLSVTNNGVLPGSGLMLFEISDKIKVDNDIKVIFKDSLKKPFEQILNNAGLDIENIIKIIRDSDYNLLYNVKNNQFENISDTLVLDPTNVVIDSLKNAVSIATMLLTTNSLVINEQLNSLNKITNYTEI